MDLLHPKVVHIPIALGVLMPLISSGLLVAWWRQWLPKRAWILAVALQAILVASGLVAMKAGEHEEERVEHVVGESAIHEHEEAAEAFLWAGAAVLVLAVAAAVVKKERAALGLAGATAVGTLVVFGLGYETGKEGGELVYEHGAASAYVDGAVAPPANDDDD